MSVIFFSKIKEYELNLFKERDSGKVLIDHGELKTRLDQLSNDELGLLLSLIYIIKIEKSSQLVKVDQEEHDDDIMDVKKYWNSIYWFGLKNNVNLIKKECSEIIHYFNNLEQNKINDILNSQFSPNFLIDILFKNKWSSLGYMYLSVYSYVNEEIWDDVNAGYISKLNLLRDRYAKELFDNGLLKECFQLKNKDFYEKPVFKGGSSLDFMLFENYVRFGEESIFYIMNKSLSKVKNEEDKKKYLYYFSSMSNSIIRDDNYKFMARVGQKYFKNINIYAQEHDDIYSDYRNYFLRNLNDKGYRFANEMIKFVDFKELDSNLINFKIDSENKAKIILDIQCLTLLDFYNKYTPENLSTFENASFLSENKEVLHQLLAVNGWFFYLVKLMTNVEVFFEDKSFKTDLKIFVNRDTSSVVIDFELKSEEFKSEDIFLILKNMISLTYKREENIDNNRAKEMNYQLLETIVNKTLMQQDIKNKGIETIKRVKKF